MTSTTRTTRTTRPAPVSAAMADGYLAANAQRAEDGRKPVTLGTWLHWTLQGTAKRYSVHYQRRIGAILAADPTVTAVRSAGGSVALVRA